MQSEKQRAYGALEVTLSKFCSTFKLFNGQLHTWHLRDGRREPVQRFRMQDRQGILGQLTV